MQAFEDLLDKAILLVGGEQIEAGGRKILDESEFLNSRVSLRLGDPVAVSSAIAAAKGDLEHLGVTVEQLDFGVFLTSSYLKISEVRHRMRLQDLGSAVPDLHLTTPTRPAALRSPRSGCTIEACIVLATQQPQQPLRPWRLGSWVCRRSWDLTSEVAFTGFTPRPLTPEVRARLKLGAKAVRYITLDGVSPLEEGFGEDAVQVWFDADLMAKMSANPKSKASVALQYQLFLDAVLAIVTESRMGEQFDLMSWDEIERTILGRIIGMLVPVSAGEVARKSACASYLDMLKSDVARFMSHVEDAIGVASALNAGLDG
ncbi:MAG: hypothetical protein ABMA25_00385 [Ilumatobacteraceae bacterium]